MTGTVKERTIECTTTTYDDRLEGDNSNNFLAVMEDTEGYTAPCPVCEKRVFDVYDPPDKPTRIRIKCPHCRKIVKIPVSTALRGSRNKK